MEVQYSENFSLLEGAAQISPLNQEFTVCIKFQPLVLEMMRISRIYTFYLLQVSFCFYIYIFYRIRYILIYMTCRESGGIFQL